MEYFYKLKRLPFSANLNYADLFCFFAFLISLMKGWLGFALVLEEWIVSSNALFPSHCDLIFF